MGNHQVRRFKRQELYDLVWSKPMHSLSQELGISDVGLAKVCRAHCIPSPPRGYWAKLRSGHSVRATPLPKVNGESMDQIQFSTRQRYEPPEEARQDALKKLADERANGAPVVVADTLIDPHPLVARTFRSLRSAREDSNGICVPKAGRCLDLHVSRASFDRAERILDALFKALLARGHRIAVTNDEPSRTIVTVHQEELVFSMTEDAVRIEKIESFFNRSHDYEYRPNGLLTIRVRAAAAELSRRPWSDGKKKLEDQLNFVLAGMVKLSGEVAEHRATCARREQEADAEREVRRLQLERDRLDREASRAQERERQRLREEEEARVRDLNSKIEAWEAAKRIRTFVAAARTELGDGSTDHAILEILAWASRHADHIDPITKIGSANATAVRRTEE